MARRLADGLWQFDLGLVPPFATNVFLVDDGDVTLVDTGLPVNRPTARSELAAAGYEVADVDRVLLTHYDLDHVGGLARLGGLDAPVYMGAADVDLVRGDWHPRWTHHKGAFHRLARRFFSMRDYDLRGVRDGETVGQFEAFHTPGHNPGHTVFVHEGVDAAFLGDLVWGKESGLTVPFWLDSYDMREITRSVRSFADRTPPFERGLMSHGDVVLADGDERIRALAGELSERRGDAGSGQNT